MPGMLTAKIFRNGRNQAVRIPVEMSFATDTVTLEKHGDALIVRPQRQGGWAEYFADESARMPEDFVIPEDLPLPERDPL